MSWEREWRLYKEKPLLVSACLVGVGCRFDGADKADPAVLRALKGRIFIPSARNSWEDSLPPDCGRR